MPRKVPPVAVSPRRSGDPEPGLTCLLVTHRAIGADLGRLDAALSHVADDWMAPAQASAICRYAAALLRQIGAHQDDEDQILWPVVAIAAGQCVDLAPLSDDHQAIAEVLSRAGRLLAAYAADPARCAARLRGPVRDLRVMLADHMADEEAQLIPAMRRYLPAPAYQWCERQSWRRGSLSALRFRAGWLTQFAEPAELNRILTTAGWRASLPLAARHHYQRLERHAFGTT